MGMDGGGSSSGGAKKAKSKRDPFMNLRRRISLFLTRLKNLNKTREKERLTKEARERLAEEAREEERPREQEERLAEEAREEERSAKEDRELEEWRENIRKAAGITYEMWVVRAKEKEDPNDSESTKEFMRRIREGEITKETFIQGVLKASQEGEVVEDDFEDEGEWPSSSNSP